MIDHLLSLQKSEPEYYTDDIIKACGMTSKVLSCRGLRIGKEIYPNYCSSGWEGGRVLGLANQTIGWIWLWGH